MYKWILAVVIVLPIIELWGILRVGDWLGGWTTFWIIVLMAIAGAYFARMEGRRVWREAQRQMQSGQAPGRTLLDGICVLAGGFLFMLPGFLSDLIGILLLLPFTRPLFRQILLQWIEKWMKNGNYTIRRY